MKLGVITSYHGMWGGSEELWYQTADAALRAGDSVTIGLPLHPGDHPRFAELERRGVRVVHRRDRVADIAVRISGMLDRLARRLPGPLRVLSRKLYERASRYRQSRSTLRRFLAGGPDVVLLNEGGSVPNAEAMAELTRVRPSVPYVIVCHNNHGAVLEDAERARIGDFYANAAEACFVAAATQAMTERQLAMPLAGRIVRNPVNLRDTTLVAWPSASPLRFATLGWLRVDWKGQDLLLDALSGTAWRDRDWQLSIFGAGDHERYLERLIAHYALADRVTLAGRTSDVRGVWARHHALIVPSRVESAPLVVVEAMLCGRPVIATDVGGITEWVVEPESGFIAEGATTGSLARALERAWRARDAWEAMGLAARSAALERYDPEPSAAVLRILRDASDRARG